MLRDLKLGQYYPGNSILHCLDPRTKLLILLIITSAAFILKPGLELFGLVCLIFALMKLSKISLRWHLSSLRAIWPLLFLTIIINTWAHPGRPLLWLGPIKFSVEGLELGISMAVRITLTIFATSLFTFTTSPIQLTDGMDKLLQPLKKIGLPASDLAMMMTIALRFVPTIVQEAERLIQAVQARGGDFSSVGLVKKARSLLPLLIPLVIGVARRADDLALAMDARCYQVGRPRSNYRQLKLGRTDILVLLFGVLLLILLIVSRF